MATSLTEIQTEVIDLATESFETFCEDISGMFGIDMDCSNGDSTIETVKDLKKRFKKLVAINTVKTEGLLNGTFHLIFDKEGLFTLGGVIVMLPEQRIVDIRKRGTEDDAKGMSDAIGESGNLLVGSWDRIFREGLDGHKHFLQTDTFIGNPWDKPDETIGLSADEEMILVPYEMTIGDYPTFNCAVMFPKSFFEDTPQADPVAPAAKEDTPPEPEAEEKAEAEVEVEVKEEEITEESKTEEAETKTESITEEEPEPEPPAAEDQTAEEENTQELETASQEVEPEAEVAEEEQVAEVPPVAEEKTAEEENTQEPETASQEVEPEAEVAEEEQVAEVPPAASEQEESSDEDTLETNKVEAAEAETEIEAKEQETDAGEQPTPDGGQVYEAIQQMTSPAVDLSGKDTNFDPAICAQDIMQKQTPWANAEDSIQQAITKIQQSNSGYILIGADGKLEGIASKCDLNAALSPYLRTMFAKWRRPLDDATLQIKIKWIMSRPIVTIKPQTTIKEIMLQMCQLSKRCLPVMDQDGKIAGIVTSYDVFKALLKDNTDISLVGEVSQASSMV